MASLGSAQPAAAALGYWLAQYRRTWRGGLFSSFVIPLLWLSSIGLGVGGFIDRDGGEYAGVGYLAYLAPGLLVSLAFNAGVAACTFPVYGAIKWSKQFTAMLAAPLRVTDMLAGLFGFVAIRTGIVAAGFFIVMLLFGTVRSAWAPLAVGVALLVGLAVAAPSCAYAARARSEIQFALLNRFVVVPLTLFSGVFFPISQLPAFLQPAAWASPLWHAVELSRSAVLGMPAGLPAVLHVGYLAAWAIAGFMLARAALTRRLIV